MPFVLSATGPDALPKTQAEVDELRAARLAKKAAGISKSKRKKRPSVTEGLTNVEKLASAIFDRKLIKFVLTPDAAVEAAGWPDAPAGLVVVLPGVKGHKSYIYNIKDRLKEAQFLWNPEKKLWYRVAPEGCKETLE